MKDVCEEISSYLEDINNLDVHKWIFKNILSPLVFQFEPEHRINAFELSWLISYAKVFSKTSEPLPESGIEIAFNNFNEYL